MKHFKRRLVLVAAAGALASVLAGGALLAYFITHPAPAPFTIGAGATPLPVAGSTSSPAATSTPCSGRTAGGARWTIKPGSMAGYRVLEKFAELTLPNDAVARTSAVTGFVVLAEGTGVAPMLTDACVAVDVATLRSVDELPPPLPPATGRDGHYPEMFDTLNHPFAVFRTTAPVELSDRVMSGDTVSLQLPGELTIKGQTRPTTVKAQVRVTAGEAEVAGSFVVDAPDFGVQVPSDPDRLVQSHVTLEFLLRLFRLA